MNARAILISEDSRDPITEVEIGMDDGGLADVARLLGSFDMEDEWVSGRTDAVVIWRDHTSGLRNNRATRLLQSARGVAIYGIALVIGQIEDGGMTSLPEDITIGSIELDSAVAK